MLYPAHYSDVICLVYLPARNKRGGGVDDAAYNIKISGRADELHSPPE
jgi:hypothetical protein